MMKLHHLVDDKIHSAISIGPYASSPSSRSAQAQFGVSVLARWEVWALEAYGAPTRCQEILTVKSYDVCPAGPSL